MTEVQDLKAIAERCKGHQPLRFMRSHGALYIRNDNGIVFEVHQNRSFPDFMAENKDYADLVLAANPAAVLELIAEIERLQRFETAYKEFSDKADWVRPNAAAHELGMHVADILRKRCDDLTSHNQAQAGEIVRLRDVANLKALLPDVSDALEDLELHGQHSDQGYRKLKDWYRKVALAYRVIDGPMFGAEHGELVTQNTWLRSMVEHYAQQHAPMVPISDPHGWSTRLPGYDLPALLRDSGRYRWLRRQVENCEWMAGSSTITDKFGSVSEERVSGADDLDQTIDAALAQEQHP
jgi:hypothetical protein